MSSLTQGETHDTVSCFISITDAVVRRRARGNKRAFADTHWANSKVTIKTKCGAAPATAHYGVMRSIS
jgi:hypothetical protein